MATSTGTVTFSFGSAPGTNLVTTTVAWASITAGSFIELYWQGNDSTATHNAYEHGMAPLMIKPVVQDITAGVGFTAACLTDYRLTGDFKARWAGST